MPEGGEGGEKEEKERKKEKEGEERSGHESSFGHHRTLHQVSPNFWQA